MRIVATLWRTKCGGVYLWAGSVRADGKRGCGHCGAGIDPGKERAGTVDLSSTSRGSCSLELAWCPAFWPRLSTQPQSITTDNLLHHLLPLSIVYWNGHLQYFRTPPTAGTHSAVPQPALWYQQASLGAVIAEPSWPPWTMRCSRSSGAMSRSAMACASAGTSSPAPGW
jgi:hypothetical protein